MCPGNPAGEGDPRPRKTQKSARHHAMDLLARREYSRRELMERLHRKHPDESPEVLAEVIDGLAEDGLQSDERFAESYIRLRVSRGQGPRKIAWELLQRGIPDSQSGPLLEEFDWPSLALEVLIKKFGYTEPQDLREKARMVRFLEQRGFDAQSVL